MTLKVQTFIRDKDTDKKVRMGAESKEQMLTGSLYVNHVDWPNWPEGAIGLRLTPEFLYENVKEEK